MVFNMLVSKYVYIALVYVVILFTAICKAEAWNTTSLTKT